MNLLITRKAEFCKDTKCPFQIYLTISKYKGYVYRKTILHLLNIIMKTKLFFSIVSTRKLNIFLNKKLSNDAFEYFSHVLLILLNKI